MSYSLFTCEGQSAVVLVSDDPIYALGPVLVADDVSEAYEAMAAFCDALGRPADEIPTISLMTEWQAFLTVVSGRTIAPLAAISPGAGDDGGHLDEETVAAAVEGPQDAVSGSEDYPADPTNAGPQTRSSESATPAVAESASGPGSAHGASGSASPTPPPPIGEPEPDDDEDEDEDDAAAIVDRIHDAPGTPAKRGRVICWGCGGECKVDVGGELVDCAVCRGAGDLPASAAAGA